MRYKTYVKKINDTLTKYKTDIDTLDSMYLADKKKLKATANEMKDKWTDNYIEQYCRDNNPDINYKARLQGTRAAVEPIVLHYLEMLEKQLDKYFNAPINPDFANKIMTIKLSGLQLTNLEFKILQDSATSYMERRLLNQLAESRTKTETKAVINKESGEAEYKTEQALNPYINLELPNIEDTYNAMKSYMTSAKSLLYQYAGTSGKMAHLLDVETPDYISVSMDSYIRNNAADEFLGAMDKANAILPESKVKRALTENDKKLIDTMIDPRYPSLAKDKVKALAEADSSIESLLLLDERYSKYLEE